MNKTRVINFKGTEIVLDPIDHAVDDSRYGLGNNEVYGHVKLTDNIDSDSDASDGVAATPHAVKEACSLTNATDILAVSHGGTGNTYFEHGEVLIGNGNDKVQTRAVVNEIGTDPDSTYIPTAGAVRKEINRVAGGGVDVSQAIGILAIEHGGTGKSYLTSVGPMQGGEAATTTDVPSARGVRNAIAKHAVLAADYATPGHVKVWVSGTTLYIQGTGDLIDNV